MNRVSWTPKILKRVDVYGCIPNYPENTELVSVLLECVLNRLRTVCSWLAGYGVDVELPEGDSRSVGRGSRVYLFC